MGAAGGRSDQEDPRRGRRARRHREHHQRPGARCSRSIPPSAARAGFTPQEVEVDTAAIMQGEPAPTPVVRQRPLLHPSRALSRRARARSETIQQHAAGQRHRQDRDARLARQRRSRFPGRPRSAARTCSATCTVTARLEGVTSAPASRPCRRRSPACNLPPAIRVEYGGAVRGAAEIVPRSG